MNELIRDLPFGITALLLASLIVLWIGSFLFMRSRTSVYLKMTGLALITVWFYLTGTVMTESSADLMAAHFWWHWGWTSPLSVVLWFHGVAHLTGVRQRSPGFVIAMLAVGYILGAVLLLLGFRTDLVVDHSNVLLLSDQGVHRFVTEPGVLYPLALAHIFFYLGSTTLLLFEMLRQGPDIRKRRGAQNAMLASGSLLLLIGSFIIGLLLEYGPTINIAESAFQPMLLVGLLMVSYASISYEGLMETRAMSRRFAYSSIAAFVLAGLLVLILTLDGARVIEVLLVMGIFVIGFSYHDAAVNSSERLITSSALRLSDLFGRPISLKQQGGAAEAVYLRDEDADERLLQVGLAIQHFHDTEVLSLSPLIKLKIVVGSEAYRSAYGSEFTLNGPSELGEHLLDQDLLVNELRTLIKTAVGHLRPTGVDDPGTETFDDVWGPYAACLYYIEGGRAAEATWRKRWRLANSDAGVEVAKPLELRLINWRKSESQALHRKWKNRYLADGVAGVVRALLEGESHV